MAPVGLFGMVIALCMLASVCTAEKCEAEEHIITFLCEDNEVVEIENFPPTEPCSRSIVRVQGKVNTPNFCYINIPKGTTITILEMNTHTLQTIPATESDCLSRSERVLITNRDSPNIEQCIAGRAQVSCGQMTGNCLPAQTEGFSPLVISEQSSSKRLRMNILLTHVSSYLVFQAIRNQAKDHGGSYLFPCSDTNHIHQSFYCDSYPNCPSKHTQYPIIHYPDEQEDCESFNNLTSTMGSFTTPWTRSEYNIDWGAAIGWAFLLAGVGILLEGGIIVVMMSCKQRKAAEIVLTFVIAYNGALVFVGALLIGIIRNNGGNLTFPVAMLISGSVMLIAQIIVYYSDLRKRKLNLILHRNTQSSAPTLPPRADNNTTATDFPAEPPNYFTVSGHTVNQSAANQLPDYESGAYAPPSYEDALKMAQAAQEEPGNGQTSSPANQS